MFDFITNFIEGLIKAPFICCGWIIVGIVAGGLARAITQTKAGFFDLFLGLIGALVGGVLVGLLGIARPDGGLPAVIVSTIVATGGAVLLIVVWRALQNRPIGR